MKKNTSEIKKVGVWMDHAEAKFIQPDASVDKIKVIHSLLESQLRIPGEHGDGTRLGNNRSTNNESHKHFKEQNELHSYYKQLADELSTYDDIFIFGPTTAQNEFHNYLQKEKKFSEKRIVARKENYMTENQMKEKVMSHFSEE